MTDLQLDAQGAWFSGARRWPCSNWDQRPQGVAVELVVIHGISLPPGRFGGGCVQRLFNNELDWEQDPFFKTIKGLKVSSHLFIERDGRLNQFVSLARRAWHAGESAFRGRPRCNDFSIGIELEGTDDCPYTDAQYAALHATLEVLLTRFPALGPDRVVGHCHIAPGRKTDPGPAFDWQRLRRALAGLP